MRAIREGAHPKILEFEDALIKRLAKHMVPMWAHSIVRGAKQQEAAFAGGFSKARFGKSPHNFGCAVDLVHGTKAWGLSEDAWKIIGDIGKEVAKSRGVPIVWGGDFQSLWDPAHWELRDWKTEKVNFPWLPPTPSVQTQFKQALNRPLPTDL